LAAYLRPTAPIAPRVLLPADPALALALAQHLLDKPLMANHSHGLWGYSGRDRDGHELTIQATGIGGPSAAVVLAELAAHGARLAIRIGTCRALEPGPKPGSALIVSEALGGDGASRVLGAPVSLPDPALTAALAHAAPAAATTRILSLDLPVELAPAGPADADGAAVADLETAALLALGAQLGLRMACALVVAETGAGAADEEQTEGALLRLGEAAAEALRDCEAAAEPRRC
jgi:uridine phosphorylase